MVNKNDHFSQPSNTGSTTTTTTIEELKNEELMSLHKRPIHGARQKSKAKTIAALNLNRLGAAHLTVL